jgi:hypothetical protein
VSHCRQSRVPSKIARSSPSELRCWLPYLRDDPEEPDIGGRFALAERIVGRGKIAIQRRRVRTTLEAWLSIWRDLLYRGYQTEVQSRNPDQLTSFESVAQPVAPADRYGVVKAISTTLAAVDSNANLRLAMEALMLDLPVV